MHPTPLRAYHGDPQIKADRIARIRAHVAADDLVRGATGANGKGCAVWCTLDAYDHARYEVELGIPEWLARVEDTIFEGMSIDKSRAWPEAFLQACAPGADLERAKVPFLIAVLESTLSTFDHDRYPDVLAAVQGSISLWRRDDVGSKEWIAAARVAAGAAAGAAGAAGAAAGAAAGVAAWAAAGDAAGAAWAAAWAAWAAAWAAAYDAFADKLLAILSSIDPETSHVD